MQPGGGRKRMSSLKLKKMLTSTIRILEPRVYTDEYVTTNRNRETDGVIYERPTATDPVLKPILSDLFPDINGGGRVGSYLCERTQDSSGISMILETIDLVPGRNAVDTAGREMKVKVT